MVTIRRASTDDIAEAGRICFEAFSAINTAHGFPPDLDRSGALWVMTQVFSDPGHVCWVAEQDGRVIGSNCIDVRDAIIGLGPITVDPAAQNSGAGRALMQVALDYAQDHRAAGVRLVQAAFHNRSLSLYAKLGFVAREPLSVMQGAALNLTFDGLLVRAATPDDLAACNAVCHRVHGHDRSGDLSVSIAEGGATVVERQGRITGYASGLAFWSHAVAETNLDLQALIGAAPAFGGAGILVPTCNAELFLWCLEHGLRVVEPMTLMSAGLYSEPAGAFLPSILY
ncbi:MAG TPA: GNAT family N-acetyltransferase [Candidatus Acidoferrum sp.]|nr:GNAT family N-acetyltransferase [Candidatus Acidoferrum sp.]